MRKRLIERITHARRGSLGYTLTELLVVIGIIAALCAIMIPGIFHIRNALRFAQANNYAKSIFLAAQQNLTELRSDGGLGPVQSAGDASIIRNQVAGFPDEFRSEYRYTTNGKEAFSRVLPAGSIDADIRDDQIIIEYNPTTGNVYAVFYYSKNDLNLVSQYEGGGLPREEDARRSMMVGYYDGSGLNSSQIELEQTQAAVEFVNGEEGIVQVKVPMPESFYGDFNTFAQALDIDLTITGEYSTAKAAELGQPITPMVIPIKNVGSMTGCKLDVDGKTVIMEYAIDSLANRLSFVNYISDTQKKPAGEGASADRSLTTLLEETEFLYSILPGENITIQADVTFVGTGADLVQIDPGILSGVNPMFETLQPGATEGRYVLTVSNGRNLQNLNAICPTIARLVEAVSFTDDIYWNDTVNYYNDAYAGGNTYHNTTNITVAGVEKPVYDEAPARALPYFVPIHSEDLFGTARFIFPGQNSEGDSEDGGLGDYIWGKIKDSLEGTIKDFGGFLNNEIPTLTDELDLVGRAHATIQGNGHRVYNLRIDSTQYQIPNEGLRKETVDINGNPVTVDYTGTFYATGDYQLVDYAFTGLFGYVNTPIDDLHVVNPIIKGHPLTHNQVSVPHYITIWVPIIGNITVPGEPDLVNVYNNPATGALVGASGYNTWITNCSTYIDKDARGYMNLIWGPQAYNELAYQNWYGVMGEGAVGGLVGYAKSHLNTTGEINGQEVALSFSDCFAAVPVSGNMRGNREKQFGYSNGVGAFIGNAQLTNFYNCYASGDVLANGCAVYSTQLGNLVDWTSVFGVKLDLLYCGRTSMGAGGFVGSSHGTRYTNCFATGNVDAAVSSGSKHTLGGGGFVGFMSIDETFNYGHAADEYSNIAQRTVFTNCYSVGQATTNDSVYENFSGANGRIALKLNQSATYIVGDYFRLYAPYYKNNRADPGFESIYIYRDSYFLSNYHDDVKSQDNSSSCASPDVYSTFENLPGVHEKNSAWMTSELNEIKNIGLAWIWAGTGEKPLDPSDDVYVAYKTYQTEYFDQVSGLDGIYKNLYDAGYSSSEWNSATASTTHPYRLGSGQRYPFSKLIGLDYYGDWPSKPSDLGLAYFETYKDTGKTHYFFDQNHISDAALSLREGENVLVSEDGYAIFSASDDSLKVTVSSDDSTVTDTLTPTGETYTVSSNTYHVFRLSKKLMAALPSDGEFYVKVTAQHVGTSTKYTMYFNPTVALSHVNPTDSRTHADKPDAAPTTIYIRSARQFKAIAALDDFWGENTRYIQQLNIDARVWADQGKDLKLTSIGSGKKPFNADYSAGYTIENNGVTQEKQYTITGFEAADTGIFGCIGEKGSVSDVIVEFGSNITAGTAEKEHTAVLAAVNGGTIDNVTLNLKGKTDLTAKTNSGLLAGLSSGIITDCTVNAEKKVTLNSANAGGLIGSAAGTDQRRSVVTDSTLTLKDSLTIGTAEYAGGFIGTARYASVSGAALTATELNTQAAYAGGLFGYAEESALVGAAKDGIPEVAISGALTARGYAAGVLASGKNVTMTGMDLSVKSISGTTAAGFLGSGDNVDPSNCTVKVTQAISGQVGAAGAAAAIGTDSIFNRVSVDLSRATVSASNGNAAGYALAIKPGAMVMGQSNVTMDGTAIRASGDAAGFVCTLAGSAGDVQVTGKGSISGANAAGFACSITGAVQTAHVSPAVNNDGYPGNGNGNLTVNGTHSAAGFVLNVGEKGNVSNCYTLCSITSSGKIQIEKQPRAADETTEPTEATDATDAAEISESTETTAPTEPPMESVTSAYGFVGTNDGNISRCMANVDLADGFAFAGINNHLITTCYGWYGDGVEKTGTAPETVSAARAVMSGTGRCNSSYFAPLENSKRTEEAVTIYDARGIAAQTTYSMLENVSLDGFTTGYKAYPYRQMNPADYPYPMLRDHYGNWVTPPEYAYGVAYYETYDDGDVRLHMVDLSNSSNTMEQTDLSRTEGSFDNSGNILETGYAMFYNDETGARDGKVVLTKQIGSYTYSFYAIEEPGEKAIEATTELTRSAVIDTRFADAIVTDADSFDEGYVFQVRTPGQLAGIGGRNASYIQTHSITTTDVTTAAIADGRTFNGNNLVLTISGQTRVWLEKVDGTVENLNLVITDAVTAPVFETVSGSVNLNSVSLGSVASGGSLVANAGGTVTMPGVTVTGSVDGSIFANVTGTVNAGSIRTGAMNGYLAAAITSGSLTTGDITLASRANPLVATFTGGMLQGSGSDRKTITIASDSAAPLFGQTVGGDIRNYQYTAGTVFGGLAQTMNGTLSDVTARVTGSTGTPFLTVLNGSMDNVRFTVDGSAEAAMIGSAGADSVLNGVELTVGGKASQALIATLGGRMTNSTIHAGSAEKGLIGTLSNAMEQVTLTVDGSLKGSAIGVSTADLTKVTLSADSATATGGVLVGSNSGSITGCTVDVGTVTAQGTSFGVVADRLDKGKNLSAAVTVDDLIYTAVANANAGGLLGTNGGTVTGSTVTIQAVLPAAEEQTGDETTAPVEPQALPQGVKLSGAKDCTVTFGGLTGTNSGSIESSKANVSVTYVQPADAAITTDKVNIGGLVGTMQGGTLTGTGADDATGSITLTGTGKGRGYVVGGAIGTLTGGSATTTAVNVTVAPQWAGSANRDGANTFGSSGIANNGPVGMFVGYAGNGTLTNCASTDKTNQTYQFLGEAMVETPPLTNIWKSPVKINGALRAYSDHAVDGVYNTYDPVGYSFSAAPSTSRVATNLTGCFFEISGETKEQLYGMNEYYYAQTSAKENRYAIGVSAAVPTVNSRNVTFIRGDYVNKGTVPTGYYYLKNGIYYPVSVKYEEPYVFPSLQRKFILVETGNEENVLETKKAEYNAGKVRYESTFTLQTISNAVLNGTYATIKANGYAINSQGAEYAVPANRQIDQRDNLLNCIWTASGNTITNIADGTVYAVNTSFTRNGTPVMVYEVGGISFHLYPVTITANGSSYSILTFTYQDNADYQRQFITAK